MKTTIYGTPLVLGVQQPKPLQNCPDGKCRIRMRDDSVAVLFVRPSSGGIRKFYIADLGTH